VDILHFDGHGVFDTVDHSKAPAHDTAKPIGNLKKEGSEERQRGFLLFEDKKGQKHHVDAETLGNMLNQKKVGLIILSACQSATLGGDEPMSSVAARLNHAGIPAVLAMTHSVLVDTTHQLFTTFYESLAYGAGIGQSLDDARRHLYSHPERGERQRGQERIILKLYDWFLPALYQAGADTPLLTDSEVSSPISPPKYSHNLPPIQEAGFFGRSYELWQIEHAFTVQGTRRLTLSGFGGQGKTYLAIEAGQWLSRTGLFQLVCFVDYAAFQGVDAVGLAISTLGTVLEKSLVDAAAATAALRDKPTLLILDNLETIAPQPLRKLLDVAKQWSEVGACRVLLTTRTPDFHHPDYPTEGRLIHQALPLSGLAPDDALAYFQRLLKLPPPPQVELPKREVVLEIFKQVSFHPLSIGLVARQLKIRRPAELGMRLEKLIAQTPDNPLLASLNLSLDRLDEEARRWLPRLGVFQGGALEEVLLGVTGLGKTDKDPEIAKVRQMLKALQSGDLRTFLRLAGIDIPEDVELPEEIAQQFLQQLVEDDKVKQLSEKLADVPQSALAEGVDESTWIMLRQSLEATGLIQSEYLSGGKTYLKFHPTLALALWTCLGAEEQTQLLAHHRQRYYELSGYLYFEDRKNPDQIRAIALRELPNLLYAVHGALDAYEEWAVEFVNFVNLFLGYFGLKRDSKALSQLAENASGEVGSKKWFLALGNKGDNLFRQGRYQEAAQVFSEMLTGLGEQTSYKHCLIFERLGKCFSAQGQITVVPTNQCRY